MRRHVLIAGGIAAVYVAACVWTLLQHHMFASVMIRMVSCFATALMCMSLWFWVARRLKRWDIIDVAWGICIASIAFTSFWLQERRELAFDIQTVTTALVVIWALRLSAHIAKRFTPSSKEDPRYVALRKNWKGSVARNMYVRVYVVQAVLALIVCLPVIHINLLGDMAWNRWAVLGALVCLLGIAIETLADYQLTQFLRQPNRPALFTGGLWKYSRHPNYFGEISVWWGFAIIALGTPHGWVGLGGALAITYLLVFVSGVPLAEARAAHKKEWPAYKRRTSVLIPLPPKG